MKIVNWITGRLSEPSSYAAIGVGVIGIGMIAGVGELLFIGVACAVLGLILAEEAKKQGEGQVLTLDPFFFFSTGVFYTHLDSRIG